MAAVPAGWCLPAALQPVLVRVEPPILGILGGPTGNPGPSSSQARLHMPGGSWLLTWGIGSQYRGNLNNQKLLKILNLLLFSGFPCVTIKFKCYPDTKIEVGFY